MKNARRIATGSCALLLAAATAAFAAGGDPDSTFGSGGVATTVENGYAWNTRVQSDGKVLVGGTDNGANCAGVMRLQADGTLDTSYGTSGRALDADVRGSQDFTTDASDRVLVAGGGTVTVTTSGKGGKTTTTTVNAAVVGRLTTSGAIDTSFGTNGRAAVIVPNTQSSFAKAVAVQPDGKILLAGFASIVVKPHGMVDYQNALFVARLQSNGALDSSFGSGGVVLDDPTPNDDFMYPGCIALQSDGKVLVGSFCGSVPTGYQYAWTIRRFSASGVLDTSFGPVMTGGALIHSIAVDASDRILAVGNLYVGSSNDMLCRRYTSGGALDTTFGSGGSTSIHYADNNAALKVAIQADGKTVFTGAVGPNGAPTGALVVRLDGAGALDSAFGSGGLTTPLVLQDAVNYALGVDFAPDGKIVVGGYAWNTTSVATRVWFAARYAAD
jgi:uncharacterized delta-60 repeat protein